MTELQAFFDMLSQQDVKIENEPIAKRTRSKCKSMVESKESKESKEDTVPRWEEKFVSASQLQNYCLDDPLCDFFELYLPAPEPHPLQSLFTKGVDFENEMIQALRDRTGWELPRCSSLSTSRLYEEAHSVSDYQRTLAWMTRGDAVIYSAYLCDRVHYLHGIPDVLVRNDCLSLISPTLTNLPSKPSHFGNYYYVPVEIKFSTLKRTYQGRFLTDTGRMRYYKTQLMMYARLLTTAQGVFPGEAYVVGKRVVDGSGTHYPPGWQTPGRVDFLTRDGHYAGLLDQAVEWMRRVKSEGREWRIGRLPRELYPNMKAVHPYHQTLKAQWAAHLHDITEVWRCTPEHRANARKHRVYTWDDPRCCSAILGISPGYAATVDQILEVNRGTEPFLPKRIVDKRLFQFGHPDDCMYVDFEVMMSNDDLPSQASQASEDSTERLFLIGVVYRGQYHAWQIDHDSLEEERRIMTEFDQFCQSHSYPVCLYWYAEADFWSRACDRVQTDFPIDHWVDLYDPWIAQRIVFRGSLNFKLKSLVGAMRELGLTTLDMPSDECANGVQAMEMARACFSSSQVDIHSERQACLAAIQAYNELDCRYVHALYEFACRLRDRGDSGDSGDH